MTTRLSSAYMITVEIIVTGNEVLLGDVLDTNTNWMCKRITAFGGRVERAVIVRDEMDAIVREVRSSLERSVRLIVTIGGMGPTWDDITVAAVAHAIPSSPAATPAGARHRAAAI